MLHVPLDQDGVNQYKASHTKEIPAIHSRASWDTLRDNTINSGLSVAASASLLGPSFGKIDGGPCVQARGTSLCGDRKQRAYEIQTRHISCECRFWSFQSNPSRTKTPFGSRPFIQLKRRTKTSPDQMILMAASRKEEAKKLGHSRCLPRS